MRPFEMRRIMGAMLFFISIAILLASPMALGGEVKRGSWDASPNPRSKAKRVEIQLRTAQAECLDHFLHEQLCRQDTYVIDAKAGKITMEGRLHFADFIEAIVRRLEASIDFEGPDVSISGKYCVVWYRGEAGAMYLRMFETSQRCLLEFYIADVSRHAWTRIGSRDILLYSVYSIYGKAGLYAVDPNHPAVRKALIPDVDVDAELFDIDRIDGRTLYYNRCRDVSSKTCDEDMKVAHEYDLQNLGVLFPD